MDNTDANIFGKKKPCVNPLVRSCVSVDEVSDTYDTNTRLGVALIFNHTDFSEEQKLSKRGGTEYDFVRLQRVLSDNGFDVRPHSDLSFAKICDVLESVSQEDHSNNDCLFVAVMTHGSNGRLCAYNKPYPVETIWEPFLGNNCKSLIGKPKLFFIQACRGENYDIGVELTEYRGSFDTVTPEVITKIPTTADLLVMYASFDERVSIRPPAGSWFIQVLCEELEKSFKAKEPTELLHLLTAVSCRVSSAYQLEVKKYVIKEMPTLNSTLTKKFYLRNKDK